MGEIAGVNTASLVKELMMMMKHMALSPPAERGKEQGKEGCCQGSLRHFHLQSGQDKHRAISPLVRAWSKVQESVLW